jgi:hypothetical protein
VTTADSDLTRARAGSALTYLPGALRVIGAAFGLFALANLLVFWSFMTWWPRPRGLGQWILAVVGVAAWLPQAPAYAAFDVLETFRRFNGVESYLTLTLLSTTLYAPIILWQRERSARRRTTS